MEYTFTCNCYEPPVREDIRVFADSFNDAWEKAKAKFARKHKINKQDIYITALRKPAASSSAE